MAQVEGYWNIKPAIAKVTFPVRGKFQVALKDSRQIIMPISAFPSIKKVPVITIEIVYTKFDSPARH